MIDTIHLMIRSYIMKKYNYYRIIKSKMIPDELTEIDISRQYQFKGYFYRFRISSVYGDLHIKGSISKLHLKDNFHRLNYKDFKKAIQKLTKKLGIDLSDAYVTRIDFGLNIPVQMPVKEYIKLLEYANEYSIKDQPYGRYFNLTSNTNTKTKESSPNNFEDLTTSKSEEVSSRVMVFYDKYSKLGEEKKGEARCIYGDYLLRYEMRLHYYIKDALNMSKEPCLKDVLKPDFLIKLNNLWFCEYKKIVKSRIFTLPKERLSCAEQKDFEELINIQTNGGIVDALIESDNRVYDVKHIAKAKSLSRKNLLSKYSNSRHLQPNPLILELDRYIYALFMFNHYDILAGSN